MNHQYSNHLINETSPYLIQHAHNPVNWYAWGKPALEKAKQENKVILISIGYSACHWCHVMERESFENEDTAALMNEHFINIKIDREERPDIDHVYMDAVQAMTGSGGWPLNVFLTPDAKPFYGGTYFPPVKAFNRASWTEVLSGVVTAWKDRRTEMEAQAEHLTEHISKAGNFTLPVKRLLAADFENEFGFEKCETMFKAIMQSADKEWGGFGRAPKFPQTFSIQFLLQYYHYTSDEAALQQALLSIDKMLDGGIYDHIAGGLARYSTDNEWLAPHFEKMLYDNALFIMILCDAFQITKLAKYKLAINKTIGFIKNEMLHPEGGFYAALDADSEGEEGKFYVWEKKEIDKILGVDAALFCDFFDVSENGNWEGKNILRILKPVTDFAQQRQLDKAGLLQVMDECLQKLGVERKKRTRPGLDDKIILGWNALMLKAIAKAAVVLQDDNFRRIALANIDFLLKNFTVTGSSVQMMHTWKNGQAKYPAFLDDYAYLADACISMYELTFDENYIEKARELCEYTVASFSDDETIFFYYTNKGQDDIIVRKKEVYDGATPSGNGVMAFNLSRLAIIFDRKNWRNRSDNLLLAISAAALKYPASFGMWAGLLMGKMWGFTEIAVVGGGAAHLAATISSGTYIPAKIIMASTSAQNKYPMLRDKPAHDPAYIYICKDYMCCAPAKNLEEFLMGIKKE
ncbi:MAG: thioredoxin domain-containing protein [Chitinophagaceae bacterium]|nr:thioredoxin domain-containing protein [Chitinophagaceae bacterium]